MQSDICLNEKRLSGTLLGTNCYFLTKAAPCVTNFTMDWSETEFQLSPTYFPLLPLR